MDEEKKDLTPEESQASAQPQKKEKEKSAWVQQKEHLYDKVPLTLKQLDIIVTVCFILLGITFVLIILDALGVF